LGIDAGGSKAQFSLCDESGRVRSTLRRPGFTPASTNEDALAELLSSGVRALYRDAGLREDQVLSAACAGMPCWGESDTGDAMVRRAMERCLGPVPFQIVNDAEVAWAGSFALNPGINIVCGTGTIAFGTDPSGRTARCGGWSPYFSDEGSGHWLGRKLLEVFCKQADGRIGARGAVYGLVRERIKLENDFEIIPIAERDYLPYRDKVASLQMILFEAAVRGDPDAVVCYREAAHEIALNVKGILSRLHFDGPVDVSYSGGIFRAGALVMDPFRAELAALNGRLVTPVAPPWAGALMMALRLAKQDTPESLKSLIRAGNGD
jgi:N-acetylglucosamine kinase-like BadF-type ATPase